MTDRQILKRSIKKARHAHRKGAAPTATGSQQLIDASGVKWFINTDITFSTSSSASGAMSEASYTHAVQATTASGGVVSSTLNDAFDGYNTLCLSLDNSLAPCQTGNANFVMYDKLAAPATSECPGAQAINRQIVFPTMTSGSLEISRKVYVPDSDSFARWFNSVKNTGTSPATVTMVISNNLGSDSNTAIVTTSSGDNVADLSDNWVTTFQNYSGTTSSDPRLGHVLQGAGASMPLAGIQFADGDDNPFWGYTVTLAPGETASFLNFAVIQPSKAAAATKAQELAGMPAAAQACLTPTELSTVKNFVTAKTMYRLYSPITLEHLYTTDAWEYSVLGASGWNQEGVAYHVFPSPTSFGGVSTVPLMRLYSPGILQHHWTTDQNEVDVLSHSGFWTYEGVVGQVLPSAAAGAIPVYRLFLPSPTMHLWTTDAYERSVLLTRGWTDEGISSYVLP